MTPPLQRQLRLGVLRSQGRLLRGAPVATPTLPAHLAWRRRRASLSVALCPHPQPQPQDKKLGKKKKGAEGSDDDDDACGGEDAGGGGAQAEEGAGTGFDDPFFMDPDVRKNPGNRKADSFVASARACCGNAALSLPVAHVV